MPHASPSILALLACCAVAPSAAQAAGLRTYIIPESDGYGIAECFTGERGCARVVSDAWCEAHGNGGVIAYGRAEDATASIVTQTRSDAAPGILPGSIIISCSE